MKIVIFLTFLISLSCLANETKYHFYDCVKIKNGFFRGCKGRVMDFHEGPLGIEIYEVSVVDCHGMDFHTNASSKDLVATEAKECVE